MSMMANDPRARAAPPIPAAVPTTHMSLTPRPTQMAQRMAQRMALDGSADDSDEHVTTADSAPPPSPQPVHLPSAPATRIASAPACRRLDAQRHCTRTRDHPCDSHAPPLALSAPHATLTPAVLSPIHSLNHSNPPIHCALCKGLVVHVSPFLCFALLLPAACRTLHCKAVLSRCSLSCSPWL